MTEVLSNQNDKKQFELFCSNEKQIDEKQFELCMATLRRMRTVLSANIVPSELDFVSPTFFLNSQCACARMRASVFPSFRILAGN